MSGLRAALLWVVLAVAFSPVLADLARHMGENPWARYAALFPLLFIRCALREPRPERERADGMLWIVAGLALYLFAVFIGMVRFGRLGMALAAIGLCRRFALASPGSQLLIAFAVPVPQALLKLSSQELTAALLQIGALLPRALGLDIEVEGVRALFGGDELRIQRTDTGLALAPLLAGLVWYDSIMIGRPPWRSAIWAGAAAIFAIPLQALAIMLVLLSLPLVGAATGRELLTHGPWLAIALLGLLWTELRVRRVKRA